VKEVADRKEAEKQSELRSMKDSCDELVKTANADKEEYFQLYKKESGLRKAIHNKLIDIQGNIRVICRVRPVLAIERKRDGSRADVTGFFPSGEEISIQRDEYTKQKFEYDRVFPPGSTQTDVFNEVQPLCVSVLDGYNVCMFAYGQTGSGKTFTMEGYVYFALKSWIYVWDINISCRCFAL